MPNNTFFANTITKGQKHAKHGTGKQTTFSHMSNHLNQGCQLFLQQIYQI